MRGKKCRKYKNLKFWEMEIPFKMFLFYIYIV